MRLASSVFASSAWHCARRGRPCRSGLGLALSWPARRCSASALARRDSIDQAPLMRSVSLQRLLAAPCRGSCRLPTIPLRRLSSRGTHAPGRSPLRCFGLHVLYSCICTSGRGPGGSFMTGVLRGHVTGLSRTLSQPGRVAYARRRSWDLILRRFAPMVGCRQFLAARRTHMPFHLMFRHDCFCRGIRQTSCRHRLNTWPRLLGFRPDHQPCLADRRPRYSFCAKGRSTARTDPAMVFLFLFQGFGVRL